MSGHTPFDDIQMKVTRKVWKRTLVESMQKDKEIDSLKATLLRAQRVNRQLALTFQE